MYDYCLKWTFGLYGLYVTCILSFILVLESLCVDNKMHKGLNLFHDSNNLLMMTS